MTGFLQHFPGEHPGSFSHVPGSSFSTQTRREQPVDMISLTFPAPCSWPPSPQLDQLQETVLRAGSLHGVKSLSLLSATKVRRWQVGEKTLQVDFPSGDVSCQMGKAPRHRQGSQRVCRMAYSHLWRFNKLDQIFFTLLAAAKARRNDHMWKVS